MGNRSKKFVKDSCPYARDQGFNSVIFDVLPGETIFGFTIDPTGPSTDVVFATATTRASQANRIVHQMEDTNYRVFAVKATVGSDGTSQSATNYEVTKRVDGFTFYGDSIYTSDIYDVIVIGKVLY